MNFKTFLKKHNKIQQIHPPFFFGRGGRGRDASAAAGWGMSEVVLN